MVFVHFCLSVSGTFNGEKVNAKLSIQVSILKFILILK